MVKLRHFSVIAAACVAASAMAMADDQKSPPSETRPAYTPRLNSLMILTQLGHFKLWYAGAVQNWPLADYELTQLRANIVDAKRFYPNNSKSDMSAMNPAADDLGKAIEAKDSAEFVLSFNRLTNACNDCHQASGLGFIKIRVPRLSPIETSPFSDENFSGK